MTNEPTINNPLDNGYKTLVYGILEATLFTKKNIKGDLNSSQFSGTSGLVVIYRINYEQGQMN